jgi:hypothetical protein
MVDEVTVDAAVPVLERMHEDESESQESRGNHGVECRRFVAVEGNEAVDEGYEILGPRAEVVGNGRAGIAVVLTD